MKNLEDKNKKIKISIAISPEILNEIDDKTSNRSSLINWVLKQHFSEIGKNVTKIKL